MPIRHSHHAALLSRIQPSWTLLSRGLRSWAIVVALLPALPAIAQTPKAGAAQAAPVTVEEPRDIVAAIYRLAATQAKKDTSPFFDRRARERYFSKSFDLLVTTHETRAAHDAKGDGSKGNGGDAGLGFDPVSASPDAEIQKVTLKTDVVEQGKAVVSATFLNHEQPTVVTYDFVREDGEWKVNDIKGTTEKEAWSVRKILKAGAAEPTTLPGMPDAKAAPDATLPTADAPLPPKKDGTAK